MDDGTPSIYGLLCVYSRVCVWSMFWLVERVWGVAISASGWWFGRLESVTLKTQNLEVVRFVSISNSTSPLISYTLIYMIRVWLEIGLQCSIQMVKFCLVSVPDPKPTPALSVLHAGSDICTGWGLGTRLSSVTNGMLNICCCLFMRCWITSVVCAVKYAHIKETCLHLLQFTFTL